jgi:hypothetical protein
MAEYEAHLDGIGSDVDPSLLGIYQLHIVVQIPFLFDSVQRGRRDFDRRLR